MSKSLGNVIDPIDVMVISPCKDNVSIRLLTTDKVGIDLQSLHDKLNVCLLSLLMLNITEHRN